MTTIAKTVEEEVLSVSVCEQTEGGTDTNVRSGGGTRATFHHTVAVAQTIRELEAGGGGGVAEQNGRGGGRRRRRMLYQQCIVYDDLVAFLTEGKRAGQFMYILSFIIV